MNANEEFTMRLIESQLHVALKALTEAHANIATSRLEFGYETWKDEEVKLKRLANALNDFIDECAIKRLGVPKQADGAKV